MRIDSGISPYNSYPSTISSPAEPGLLSEFPIGGVEIDQSPCRSAYGPFTLGQVTQETAQKNKTAFMDALNQKVQDGHRMAAIESGENAIPAIALDNSFSQPVELTWGWIPNPILHYSTHPRNLYQAPSLDVSV